MEFEEKIGKNSDYKFVMIETAKKSGYSKECNISSQNGCLNSRLFCYEWKGGKNEKGE